MTFIQYQKDGSWHNLDMVVRYWCYDRSNPGGKERVAKVTFADGHELEFIGLEAEQIESYFLGTRNTLSNLAGFWREAKG